MSTSGVKRSHADGSGAPPPKRSGPTVSSLQRELAAEREKLRRSAESIQQLRLELMMMGRLLAATREQIVATGADSIAPQPAAPQPQPQPLVAAPSSDETALARQRADARALARMRLEVDEANAACATMGNQLKTLKHKGNILVKVKKELLALSQESEDHLTKYVE